MPEGLDTADKLNTHSCGSIIHGADLLRRISAAHHAERRFTGQFISIFTIKQHCIESQQRKPAEYFCDRRNCKNQIARQIDHDPQHGKAGVLPSGNTRHGTADTAGGGTDRIVADNRMIRCDKFHF